MVVRMCAVALAAVTLAACAGDGYSGGGVYPAEVYYDRPYEPYYYPGEVYYEGPYDPYYGGGIGFGGYYGGYHGNGYDRYYHPSRNVSCDRVRKICYDRYGPSYRATARHLGERAANKAYKKYGDSVFLFSPRPGVSCDRRTKECSDGDWVGRTARDPAKRLDRGSLGSVAPDAGFDGDDDGTRVWPLAPAGRTDDDATPTKRRKPRLESPPPMADNDAGFAKPKRRIKPEQPEPRRRFKFGDKVLNGGFGNGCPPRGCPD